MVTVRGDITDVAGAVGATSVCVCRAFGCRLPSGDITGGNPAAVLTLREPLPLSARARTAKAIGLPMTAFVVPTNVATVHRISFLSASGDEFQICGHASVAASRALAWQLDQLRVDLQLAKPFPTFSTIRTQVSVAASRVSIRLPRANLSYRPDWGINGDLAALGAIDVASIEELAVSSTGDLLISLADPSVLHALTLNEERARDWTRAAGVRGLLFTCLSDRSTHDIETRAFFPALGIGEDVACGSATCTVVPYWHRRLGGLPTSVRIGYPSTDAGGEALGGEIDVSWDGSTPTLALLGSVVLCQSEGRMRVATDARADAI